MPTEESSFQDEAQNLSPHKFYESQSNLLSAHFN